MSVVFFDFESSGLTDKHPNIQLAAVAAGDDFTELDTFQMKIQFDESLADPEALKLNHYDREVWAKEAKPEPVVLGRFDLFLQSFKSIPMVSKRTGNPYSVARLAGHNIVTFDMPRLKRMYGERFMPAHPLVLDSLQLAMWTFHGQPEAPSDYKLGTLAEWFGIECGGAHDALMDVRICIEVVKAIKEYQFRHARVVPIG